MEEKELGRDIFPKTPAEENEGPKIYLEEGDTESNTDNRFNELLNSDAYKKDNGYEYGRIEPFDYHEVYSDGEYIYDPRYSNEPVPKSDYFRSLREINPDGFDVFEKDMEP